MPREKSLIKTIPKIYKRNFENLGLFFWVEAQKNILPKVTVAQSIKNYYELLDEEYDIEICLVTISRMRAEFIELKYMKFCKEKNETAQKNI